MVQNNQSFAGDGSAIQSILVAELRAPPWNISRGSEPGCGILFRQQKNPGPYAETHDREGGSLQKF